MGVSKQYDKTHTYRLKRWYDKADIVDRRIVPEPFLSEHFREPETMSEKVSHHGELQCIKYLRIQTKIFHNKSVKTK